jgi:hypothetical protein
MLPRNFLCLFRKVLTVWEIVVMSLFMHLMSYNIFQRTEDLWAIHSQTVFPRPHKKDSPSWTAIQKVLINKVNLPLSHCNDIQLYILHSVHQFVGINLPPCRVELCNLFTDKHDHRCVNARYYKYCIDLSMYLGPVWYRGQKMVFVMSHV